MFSEIPFPSGITFLGRHGISTFSILLMLGFLFSSYLAPREFRRRGLDPNVSDWCILLAIVGAVIGSKVFFVFEVWSRIWIVDLGFWDTFYRVFFTWPGMSYAGGESMWGHLFSGGGLVFYGGFIFAFLFIYLYLRIRKLEVWKYGDTFALCAAFAYGLGRLGCFVSGDGCYGHGSSGTNIPLLTWVFGPVGESCPTDPALAWGYPYMCTDGVRVWNTPVIESLFSFALFGIFFFWGRRQNFQPGMLLFSFIVWNAFVRFFVEFLRLNDAAIPIIDPPVFTQGGIEIPLPHHIEQNLGIRPESDYFLYWHWYGFTQAQIAAFLLGAAGLFWIIFRKLYKRSPV